MLNAEQTERTSIYQSYCVFALLLIFEKESQQSKYSIYRNRLPVFSTEGSRLEEKYSHHH